jgi:hypothetical protein
LRAKETRSAAHPGIASQAKQSSLKLPQMPRWIASALRASQ